MGDGDEVIRLLSRDPHTAHHIAFELAQHFVSDNPPPALVDTHGAAHSSKRMATLRR